MANLTSAPNLNNRPHKPYEDLIVLAGRNANKAWGKGKGEEWLLLCKAIWEDPKNNPVILDRYQLEKIDSIRIVEEDQELVKIVQCGELTEAEKTAICRNLAKNSNAAEVSLLTPVGEKLDDLSNYIKGLRNDKEKMNSSQIAAPEKIILKDKDGVNIKSRAVAKYLAKDLGLFRLTNELFSYNGISWDRYNEDNLVKSIVQFFDDNNLNYSDRTIERTLGTMKVQATFIEKQPANLIAFKNGVMDRKTFEFSPHLRENWIVSYIPHDYFHVAQPTPLFDDWLDWVSYGDNDKKQIILAAFYMILMNCYNWELYLEITGQGGTGKSVFADIAKLLVGEQNYSAAELEDFEKADNMEGFEDKLLLICAEQNQYAGKGSGLKRVIGGDSVRINKKYVSRFSTVIRAVILVVNNEPTIFTDRSGGVDRRRVPIRFDRKIPDDKKDPDFKQKITSEASGIIYKIIHAFDNPKAALSLLKQQQKSKEALEIKMESDHLTHFCSYLYTSEKDDGLCIGRAEMAGKERLYLYPAYIAFVRAMNYEHELSVTKFGLSLRQALEQNNNDFEYSKTRKNGGFTTNVHFKNFDEFHNEFIKIK